MEIQAKAACWKYSKYSAHKKRATQMLTHYTAYKSKMSKQHYTARKSTMVNGREPAKFHDVAFKTLAIIKYCFVDKIMIVDQWKPTRQADGYQDQ